MQRYMEARELTPLTRVENSVNIVEATTKVHGSRYVSTNFITIYMEDDLLPRTAIGNFHARQWERPWKQIENVNILWRVGSPLTQHALCVGPFKTTQQTFFPFVTEHPRVSGPGRKTLTALSTVKAERMISFVIRVEGRIIPIPLYIHDEWLSSIKLSKTCQVHLTTPRIYTSMAE